MDARRLRCFIVLAEELHFRRAAERCHMTQSGLSQQLKALEEELQVVLLYRTKRVVELTRAGEVFLGEARRLLAQLEQAVHLARRTARGELGQLLIGATAPALFILLPAILRRFRARLPGVGLVLREMTTTEQEAALRGGEIEVGVVHPPLDDPGLCCRLVAEIPFGLVLSRDNALARRRVLRVEDLAEQHFITFPRRIGPRLYDSIVALCRQAGFSPQIILEATPAQSIIALAAAGFGVGWIASRTQHFPREDVTYRSLSGERPSLTLGVAHRATTMSPAAAAFIAIATEVGENAE